MLQPPKYRVLDYAGYTHVLRAHSARAAARWAEWILGVTVASVITEDGYPVTPDLWA